MMDGRSTLDRGANVVLTLAAVAIAVVLLHREFGAAPRRPGNELAITRQAGWERLLSEGRYVGSPAAAVKVVELMDLECPACRAFHQSAKSIREKYADSVAYVFVHVPLSNHRFAVPAARAAECAAGQDRFLPMVDVLFDKRDSLGLKSWASYAHDAGVLDTTLFRSCALSQGAVRLVEVGLAAAERISFTGTPTVIINGWRFSRPPTHEELDYAIREILAGRSPARSPSVSSGGQ